MYNPHFSSDDIVNQFAIFMANNNAKPIEHLKLILDGQTHRFRTLDDKPGHKSGAYRIYPDSLPAGWVMNWKFHSAPIPWHFNINNLPDNDTNKIFFSSPNGQVEVQRIIENRKNAEQNEHLLTLKKILSLFSSLKTAPENHPYLINKHVPSYGLKLSHSSLAIPLRDIHGSLKSIQFISVNGDKSFFPGSHIKGNFWGIALDNISDNSFILIGEGYATMAKIYELTSLPCVAAMNCGNISEVTKVLKLKFPHNKIIICADNDSSLADKNPGLNAALKAINDNNLNNEPVYPVFENSDLSDNSKLSDWNDFASLYGDDKTKRILLDKINEQKFSPKEKKLLKLKNKLDPSIALPSQDFIAGLFCRKFVSVLVAPPGTGKTLFIQKIASDLSIGGPIFGGFAEESSPKTSLILAGEAGYELLIRRGAEFKWPINPQFVHVLDQHNLELNDISLQLDNKSGFSNLEIYVRLLAPDLIFIDTFSSFHDKDENKASDMKPIIKRLAELAEKYNTAIILVHHSRKRAAKERSFSLNQDDVIGSSILNRLVSLIIGVEPMKDNEKSLLVRPLKSWFSPFIPFSFAIKEDLYGHPFIDVDLAPDGVNNSKLAFWTYLQKNFKQGEWFSLGQIVLSEINADISIHQIKRYLAVLVSSHKLNKRGFTKSAEYSIA